MVRQSEDLFEVEACGELRNVLHAVLAERVR